MPPFIPRKRLKPDSRSPDPPPKRTARSPRPPSRPRRPKESVFQTLDAPSTISRTLSQAKALLEGEGNESDHSSADSSEDDFEDVPINGTGSGSKQQDDEASTDDEEEWEDALGAQKRTRLEDEPEPVITGDIDLTLSAVPVPAAFEKTDGKRGPSKIQRQIRNVTHCMHVQFLMFHNLIRNAWIQDKQVQKILVNDLSTGCWRELDRYWRDAGISDGPQRVVQVEMSPRKTSGESHNPNVWKNTGKGGVKVFEPLTGDSLKPKSGKSKEKGPRSSDRNQRDWGVSSDRLEPNVPNLSAGDPLLRLLKYLSAYWNSKFTVTSPCLRKRGYLSPATLEAEIGAWKDHPTAAGTFGERIESLEAFRNLARKWEGSRDVGQQLFTALLRGLGIEARMVVSLQPTGFSWNQNEEGRPKNLEALKARAKTLALTNPGTFPPSRKQARLDRAHSESSELSSIISISSDSEADTKLTKKALLTPIRKTKKFGDELPHPTYWTEAISNLTHTPIIVSILPRPVITTTTSPEQLLNFYCRGVAAEKAKQVFAYLIAFSSDGTAKDVTTRYLPKHQWPGKTKGFRMPVEKIPIYNKRGKVKHWEEWDWFKSVLRPYARPLHNRQPWDEVEDEGDLIPAQPPKPKGMDEEGGKETLQGYKNSTEYLLERHLKREEALRPDAKIVRHFTIGKGSNEDKEPVYLRKDVVNCKTVESWHKEGRAVNEGEQPLKYVPMRAVTVTRKREIEEREREEGRKVKQGLYSKEQTDWIIPDPIVDGKIPRNAFGNIDVYVPTMIPEGAIHIPLKGTARVCRKLKIDYAEACTGFEFGKQRAVPVLTGVVVAMENEDLVIDAWEAEEAEKARKEQEKKEKLVLSLWKKFLSGLRIVERMKREYGDEAELPATKVSNQITEKKNSEWDTFREHEDFEGRFLREELGPCEYSAGGPVLDDEGMAGGFLPSSQDEPDHIGELTIDHGDQEQPQPSAIMEGQRQRPISLQKQVELGSDPEEDSEQDHEGSDNDEDEDEAAHSLPQTSCLTRGTPRSRSNGQAGKQTLYDRKILTENDGESPLSDAEPVHVPDVDVKGRASRKRKPQSSPPTRQAPKRKAARKSEAQVKSHFFAHGSGEETDLTDQSPKKKMNTRGRGTRGRGRARAKGR